MHWHLNSSAKKDYQRAAQAFVDQYQLPPYKSGKHFGPYNNKSMWKSLRRQFRYIDMNRPEAAIPLEPSAEVYADIEGSYL